MAEAALSATETAIENQRIGGLQIRVAALCSLIQICDGYDINSIAWAVPSLTHVWNLPGPAFTTAFLWSSIGILVGALSAGPIGDRVGRKPLLLAQRYNFRHRFAAQRLCPFAHDVNRIAVFHRLRDRRRVSGCGHPGW